MPQRVYIVSETTREQRAQIARLPERAQQLLFVLYQPWQDTSTPRVHEAMVELFDANRSGHQVPRQLQGMVRRGLTRFDDGQWSLTATGETYASLLTTRSPVIVAPATTRPDLSVTLFADRRGPRIAGALIGSGRASTMTG